ncbi:hypothetical protein [Bradyrhizobium sp. 5.13L]
MTKVRLPIGGEQSVTLSFKPTLLLASEEARVLEIDDPGWTSGHLVADTHWEVELSDRLRERVRDDPTVRLPAIVS